MITIEFWIDGKEHYPFEIWRECTCVPRKDEWVEIMSQDNKKVLSVKWLTSKFVIIHLSK